MIRIGQQHNNRQYSLTKNMSETKIAVSFGSAPQPIYKVTNSNIFKTSLPIVAFIGSVTSAVGYFVGGAGLFYDISQDKKVKNDKKKTIEPPKGLTNYKYFITPPNDASKEGVKTIIPNTKIAKACMDFTKIGMFASGVAGVACGIGEGLPIMAIGEATNLGSAKIIETPIGTGIFGIGIASIFSALALDNTPELKLNPLHLLAESNLLNKSKMVATNLKNTGKEMLTSVNEIVKNIYKPSFLKENFLSGTPKTLVFEEHINKEGIVKISKMLRHNKNYLMHAASFTLGIGGIALTISSLFQSKFAKKAQKVSLKAEEGGFLFDNMGMTRYGVDKLSTGGKAAGIPFAVGGVVNAVSQFMQIDNKEGRAMQWAGISLVFLGFSVDRGKFLKKALADSKARTELTDLVRQWRFDLTELVKNDKNGLNKLLKELKNGKPVTNEHFIDFENKFNSAFDGNFKTVEQAKESLENTFGKETSDKFRMKEIANFDKTKEVLSICTEKMFGSKNPTLIN